jgi:transposase
LVANPEEEPFSRNTTENQQVWCILIEERRILRSAQGGTHITPTAGCLSGPRRNRPMCPQRFPTGNLVMRISDDLEMLFHDFDFAELFPPQGQPALAPTRLALVTLLQFMEGLTDRQAADAVRTRLDWKSLLCLELTDRGFDHSVLSEVRSRLLAHQAECILVDAILEIARKHDLLKAGGRHRTDSTHILGAMRTLTRLEDVTETVSHVLNTLASVAPDWLRLHTDVTWLQRSASRAREYRLPTSQTKRLAWALQVEKDSLP